VSEVVIGYIGDVCESYWWCAS